jgi:predicted P-loop ATPase/GTPase
MEVLKNEVMDLRNLLRQKLTENENLAMELKQMAKMAVQRSVKPAEEIRELLEEVEEEEGKIEMGYEERLARRRAVMVRRKNVFESLSPRRFDYLVSAYAQSNFRRSGVPKAQSMQIPSLRRV